MHVIRILFLALFTFGSVTGAVDEQYVKYIRDYNTDVSTIWNQPGYLKYTALEFDSQGISWVFFVNEQSENLHVYLSHNSAGTFSDPVELFVMDSGCRILDSRIGPDDAIHLVWLDESIEVSEFYVMGKPMYAKIKDGVLLEKKELWHDPRGSYDLDIDIDSHGNLHVLLELGEFIEHEGWHFQLAYLQIINDEVQEPIIRRLNPAYSDRTYPVVCVDTPDRIYFLGKTGHSVQLLKYENGIFNEIVEVSNKLIYPEFPLKMITDQVNNLHIYLIEDDFYRYGNYALWHFVSEDNGCTFSDPDIVVMTSELFNPISEPMILKDNSKLLITQTEESPDLLFYDDFYHLDRGYGYGNPSTLLGTTGFFPPDIPVQPQVRLRSDYCFSVLATWIKWNDDEEEFYSKLQLTHHQLDLPTNPYIEIDVNSHIFSFDFNDFFRVTLDLYNPELVNRQVEMVIIVEFAGVDDGVFYFLNDENGFPSFSPEYHAFRFELPSGWYCQNVPIFELDLQSIINQFPYIGFYWYAALFDPDTGMLMGDYSFDHNNVT